MFPKDENRETEVSGFRFFVFVISNRADIVPTSPQYVSESLAAVLSHGFNGVVLSWNIMEAPLRNLDSLKK